MSFVPLSNLPLEKNTHPLRSYAVPLGGESVCRQEPGFALIATISVMVLLVMIALAMLSLSTIELRQSGAASYEQEARANARMALMLAIGELQKHAGSDTRVTARADIKADADPTKSHWTGVWNSGEWDPMDANKRKFEGWLVSNPDGSLPENDVAQELTGTDLVTLVGDGSVMEGADEVEVRKVFVSKNGSPSGSYAYWVGDEGIKASYRVPQIGEDTWNKAGNLGVAATSGISALEIPGYAALADRQLFAGSLTRKSMNLPSNDLDVSRKYFHDVTPQAVTLLTDARIGGSRLDLSTAFELPLAEFNDMEEFHAAEENNGTTFYDELGSTYKAPRFYHSAHSPDLGYVCEVPWRDNVSNGIVRGPSWDLLRNHYRLYKKEWEADSWGRSVSSVPSKSYAARGSLPHSYSGKHENDGETHHGDGVGTLGLDHQGDDFAYHLSNGSIYSKKMHGGSETETQKMSIARGDIDKTLTQERSPQLTPIVIRMTIAFGALKEKRSDDPADGSWRLGLSYDPYMTIMNPYNVPITFDSVGVWCSKFAPVEFDIKYVASGGQTVTKSWGNIFDLGHGLRGSFSMRLKPGPYTLQPGEVRVVSPALVNGGRQRRTKENSGEFALETLVPASFLYGEGAGLYFTSTTGGGRGKEVKPKQPGGTQMTIKFKAKSGAIANETERFIVSLYHAKDHDGAPRDLFERLPKNLFVNGASMYGDEDIFDQPLIANIGYSANTIGSSGEKPFTIERVINTDQLAFEAEDGSSSPTHLAIIDLKMMTTNEGFPSLTMNPRAEAFDSRDYDGLSRSSPQWDVTLKSIDALSAEELVVDPEGRGLWGEGRLSQDDGSSSFNVLYEVPRLPLSSLAQLQHVNTGATGTSGSLQIGNSFPHPGIAGLDEIVAEREALGYATNATGDTNQPPTQVLSDMAWASNEALWDRYFFSGLNWGTATETSLSMAQSYTTQQEAVDALILGDRTAAWPLQNPRMDLFTRSLTATQKAELLEHDKIANYLAVFGGFNVNSTSEKAWQAIFSSLREVEVNYIDSDGTKQNSTSTNAFSKFMIPSGASGEVFGGFRNLSDDDIESLSKAMVKQVKTRGPFMGLSDFVNRRLTTADEDGTDVGAVGALQAAIEAAELNGSHVSKKPTATNLENVSYKIDGATHHTSTYTGTAAYLTQADILNSLGGILSARSDTFVIRAYGEALDASGRVVSRAWCEATVQRAPDWLESTSETRRRPRKPDDTETPILRRWEENPDFPRINQVMGRAFKIKSFRWLSREEV